jgi:hypothetical protein
MRILPILAAIAAFLVLPSQHADATPAPAPDVHTSDHFTCTFYLAMHGYSGLIVDIGCADGERGSMVLCVGTLRIAGVPEPIAQEACRRAAE